MRLAGSITPLLLLRPPTESREWKGRSQVDNKGEKRGASHLENRREKGKEWTVVRVERTRHNNPSVCIYRELNDTGKMDYSRFARYLNLAA